MAAELGHFLLILALAAAFAGAVLPLAGSLLGIPGWMRTARPAAALTALFSTAALGLLAWCFLADDFSVLNVARNSNEALAWYYKASAVWGSHEGSVLFWLTVLSWWALAAAVRTRRLALVHSARVTGLLLAVLFGFLLFSVTTSDPFLRVFPPPMEGSDLNPLLQDPGMIFHPPLLYLGYVGFAVPFAYAVAALWGGRLTVQWAQWMRPWALASWVLLTAGIALGCFWSYYELGWGGWWGWDPVENSSLLPWLTGTALVHSLTVVCRRGTFKAWAVFLAILTFALSLLGTFIVRSGMISSLHAFASDPSRGGFILAFLAVICGPAFVLWAVRFKRVSAGARFGMLSRESWLLAGNLILLAMAAVVLLGTLYPYFLEVTGGAKISVGAPYFDRVFGWMMVPLALSCALAPLAAWGEAGRSMKFIPAAVTALVSLAAGAGLSWGLSPWSLPSTLGFALAFFLLAESAACLRHVLKGKTPRLQPFAMLVAHVGLALTVAGGIAVSCHQVQRDVPVRPGDQVTVRDVTIRYDGWSEYRGSNFTAARGTVHVLASDGTSAAVLHPEKRNYDSAKGMTLTEAAIHRRVTEDVYVALGSQTPDNTGWVIRAYVKPGISILWLGMILTALGGILAVFARPRREVEHA